MLYLFICDCNGAEGLMRKVLRSAGLSDWLERPIYKGKRRFEEFYNSLEDKYKNRLEIGALNQHLANVSSYVVILGIKGDKVIWADAKSGDVKSRLDAELIAEKFAD